jgi:hypothetical protein
MRRTSILALLLLLAASSCRMHERGIDGGSCMGPHDNDDSTSVTPKTNFRVYNSPLGSAQIVEVQFYQGVPPQNTNHGDEEIVLQSATKTVLTGWKLQAGDANQLFPLPDTLPGTLTIYSHTIPSGTTGGFALNLASGNWLWNRSGLSTVKLIDNTGAVADSMQFVH